MGSTANLRKLTSMCGPDRAHEVFCRKRSTQENLKQRTIEYLCKRTQFFSRSCRKSLRLFSNVTLKEAPENTRKLTYLFIYSNSY